MAGQGKQKKTQDGTIAKNRTAYHEYFIDEKIECGVVLTGTEVRSLRENHCQITDSFALIRKGEAFLMNVHIPHFAQGNRANVDPDRNRKLLLHKKEIRYLIGKTQEKGYALVPLALYFDENNRVKLSLGIARGKKLYDKRQDMAKRDSDREIARALKERSR